MIFFKSERDGGVFIKGTADLISIHPLFVECLVQFTTVHLTDQGSMTDLSALFLQKRL